RRERLRGVAVGVLEPVGDRAGGDGRRGELTQPFVFRQERPAAAGEVVVPADADHERVGRGTGGRVLEDEGHGATPRGSPRTASRGAGPGGTCRRALATAAASPGPLLPPPARRRGGGGMVQSGRRGAQRPRSSGGGGAAPSPGVVTPRASQFRSLEGGWTPPFLEARRAFGLS